MGIFVIVGASLLGAASCLLIAWSLWTRSQAGQQRKRVSGQRAPATGLGPGGLGEASHGDDDEPSTQFLSEAELFGDGGGASEHTQFLNPSASGPAPRRTGVLSEPSDELRTEFLSSEELFGDEAEPATQFLSSEELFGAQQGAGVAVARDDDDDEDEHEVPTQFLTSEELFGDEEEDEHELQTIIEAIPDSLASPIKRSEETIVLAQEEDLDDKPYVRPSEVPEGFAVATPEHRHMDRPPVHRMPIGPPISGPPLAKPVVRAAAPTPSPRAPAPQSRAPTPQPAQPRTPSPRAPAPRPQQVPPSRLPAGVATPAPRVPARPAPVRAAPARPAPARPDVPQAVAQPSSQGYVGFVGAPLNNDDDDDDDFDDDDPETEMVHQAELLRLMTQIKNKSPGAE